MPVPEYMSVREAAENWAISERRVHKLCEDGRIAGLIRFGRSWGIPRGAGKPDDARKPSGRRPAAVGSVGYAAGSSAGGSVCGKTGYATVGSAGGAAAGSAGDTTGSATGGAADVAVGGSAVCSAGGAAGYAAGFSAGGAAGYAAGFSGGGSARGSAGASAYGATGYATSGSAVCSAGGATGCAAGFAAGGATADFLGPDARLLAQNGACAVFQLENETGNGIVTVYDALPGVQLMYNDLHLSRISEHDSPSIPAGANMLAINHCREGRYECELPRGEYGYIGEGDMAVSALPTPAKSSSYPLAHYHGISVVADIPRAAKTVGEVSALLGTASIDVQGIKERLLGGRPYFLMRSSEAVSHIFSELYNAPGALRESYIKLKLIELLLFLSVIRPDDEGGRRYFYKTRVNAVKAMRDYMTAHLDRQFPLGELSRRFNIPMTAMKICFKSLFGAPIHAYMREYRLQTASALLRGTDAPIAEIAAKVGYDSHARFSAVFKAATGLAPSGYRKVSVQNQKSASE
jgi:AraC-like DNA-binding protein